MNWGEEAGKNVTIEIKKGNRTEATCVDDTNRYWVAFKNATEQV